MLAEMDMLHNTLSGLAAKKLMERAFQVFGDVRLERLAGTSVAHLYNRRGNKQYPNKRRHWTIHGRPHFAKHSIDDFEKV